MALKIFWKLENAAVRQPDKVIYTLPATSAEHTWTGNSDLLLQAALGNATPLTLNRNRWDFSAITTAVIAIRWTDGTYAYRYTLWDAGTLFFPVYAGEKIGADAYFELWSISSTSPAVLPANLTLPTQLIVSYVNECYVCCSAAEATATTLAWEVPPVLPPNTYCNPLCEPLC